jgi:tRNA G18 (ribose-2'-O)-methylase SpoU
VTDPLRRESVADLADPRLADYRNLKDAELLARRGRFIVEGRGNLRVLLSRTALRPESLLFSEAAWAALSAELSPLAQGIPIFVAPQSVLDAVVGFKVHRGALASCLRPASRDPAELAREVLARSPAPRVLVLEGVRDADNVGGIFRAAMAFGARAVFLCGRSCDPLYRKAIRTSMGGSLCVPFACAEEAPALLARLRTLGFCVLAFDPKEPGEALEGLRERVGGPVALVFGTEGEGLSEAALAGADRRVRIAMESGVDSLNVATAAAIGLHALRTVADASASRDGG